MYILTSYSTIVFVLAISTWARPSLSTVFNSDDTSAIIESKFDASLASLEGLTYNKRDNSGRTNGPTDKYFHESTVSHSHNASRSQSDLLISTKCSLTLIMTAASPPSFCLPKRESATSAPYCAPTSPLCTPSEPKPGSCMAHSSAGGGTAASCRGTQTSTCKCPSRRLSSWPPTTT